MLYFAVLYAAVKDHFGEYYTTFSNSCVTNALRILNSGLKPQDRIEEHVPMIATFRLGHSKIIGDRTVEFSPRNPTGGGVINPYTATLPKKR
ncbi:MAG: hypothetical protein WC421_10590 [Elusimicrobiales bacterium]